MTVLAEITEEDLVFPVITTDDSFKVRAQTEMTPGAEETEVLNGQTAFCFKEVFDLAAIPTLVRRQPPAAPHILNGTFG